jgi:uncharacterized membrane protein (TIGR02234 family)
MTVGEGQTATPPAPVNVPAPAPKAGRTATREKVLAALLAAAGAGLILASDGRGWANATVTAPVRLSVEATGSSLTSLPYALGLAGLAGAVALFAVRRIGRYLVGLVLLGAGAGTVAAVAANLGHLDGTTLAKAAEQTLGASAAQLGSVTNTAWPYVTIAGGVLVALSGLLTLARGRFWTGLSNRYEVAPGTSRATDRANPAAAAAATSAAAGSAAESGPVPASVSAGEPTSRDLWDALNRGADPTV